MSGEILTGVELAEIEKRLNAATRGRLLPWAEVRRGDTILWAVVTVDEDGVGDQTVALDASKEDAEFFAACPTDVRRLLATIRSQAEELETLRGQTLTTGYTRAQLATAVDLVHLAMHEIEEQRLIHGETANNVSLMMKSAHEALHRVGAGLTRAGCGTMDPEIQAVVQEWQRVLERELPCGHLLADLVSGTGSITQCGACILARQEAKTAEALAVVAAQWGHALTQFPDRWWGAHESKEAAIANGRATYIGESFWIASGYVPATDSFLPDVDWVLDQMRDAARERAGEAAEDYPDVADAGRVALERALAKWAAAHAAVEFWCATGTPEHIEAALVAAPATIVEQIEASMEPRGSGERTHARPHET